MLLRGLNAQFMEAVQCPPTPDTVKALAKSCAAAGRKASEQDRIKLAAALAHTAFLASDETALIYDALSEGWIGRPVAAPPVPSLNRLPEPAPDDLWAAYWTIVEDGVAGKLDALSITSRTAALGAMLPDDFHARTAEMSYLYPGVSTAVSAEMPPNIDLKTLAAAPDGSLGQQFYRLIVDNQFDLEVLDRTAIGLLELPPPLDYLNTRILQAHDLWHITAGYETTSLHEIALSAFQMAQFGHNYSAHFLSITAAIGSQSSANGFKILMDTVTSAWVHGRQSPPLMAVKWESEWHKPAAQIRSELGISLYERPYPADLIERSRPIAGLIAAITGFFGALAKPFRRAPA